MPDPVLTPAQTVTPASGVPGLCDVRLTDGRCFYDLTMGQVRDLARREPEVRAWIEGREDRDA